MYIISGWNYLSLPTASRHTSPVASISRKKILPRLSRDAIRDARIMAPRREEQPKPTTRRTRQSYRNRHLPYLIPDVITLEDFGPVFRGDPLPRLRPTFETLPPEVRQITWDLVCRQPRIVPLFPPCRRPDRRCVCPEPNPAVLSLNHESRARALLQYRVLHDGEMLQRVLDNIADAELELPDDDPWFEDNVGFTRPRTGPFKVYYNPGVDIVLITEGLEGLLTPVAIRGSWLPILYAPALGYDIAALQNLGAFWCRTGAACPRDGGHPRDLLDP